MLQLTEGMVRASVLDKANLGQRNSLGLTELGGLSQGGLGSRISTKSPMSTWRKPRKTAGFPF